MIETKQAKGLPAWASGLIIILALSAGAGIAYWFFTRGPGGNETVVLDRGPEDGIRPLPGGRQWNVVSGNTRMHVAKLPGDKFQTSFGYLQYDFITPADFTVLNKGRRIAADSAMADALGIASDQADSLREQVRRGFEIPLPEPDQKQLLDLFHAWLDAPVTSREGPELKLFRALDETGDRLAASARQTTADAVAQIQKIITTQQWEKFEQMDK